MIPPHPPSEPKPRPRLLGVHLAAPLDPGVFERWIALVPLEKRERIRRFRHWQDAHRGLIADLLARHAASTALARPMEDLAFRTTAQGKPYLPEAPGFHFNLSHSGEWVLCATAAVPVGVDVERIQPVGAELEPQVLTEEEQAMLARLPQEERPAHFFRLWTLKESYAKAHGLGLQMGFQDLSATISPTGAVQMSWRGVLDGSARIRVLEVDPAHPAALTLLQGDGTTPDPETVFLESESFIRLLS